VLQPFTSGKAVVQLVLPPAWVLRLNALATARGVNRSALIREAIARAYFDVPTDSASVEKEVVSSQHAHA
jgi:hypothetical protein